MGRRGGVVEMGRDGVWHRQVGVAVEWTVPHSRMVDKNWEGYLGSEPSQPQAKSHSPGFHHWEDKSP